MPKVTVNAPKTPVTEGSSGVAAATLPNVCKLPGPPAPFVPSPLPNIGKSGTAPKKYSKSVTIEGKRVAIRGATFGSMGDVASKGSGGGLVCANVEGPTSFVGPGSMDVKIEGKSVQLLGDPMLNNCGPNCGPANAATLTGLIQLNGLVVAVTGEDACPLCDNKHGALAETAGVQGTKADASALALDVEDMLRQKKRYWSTMLCVVHCKCGQRYADHSSPTLGEFCGVVEALGDTWHAPVPLLSLEEPFGKKDKDEEELKKVSEASQGRVLERLLGRPGNAAKSEKIEEIWELTEGLSRESYNGYRSRQETAAAYPPGACAAQKTIVLVWDGGAYPGALTERWFHVKEKQTSSPIEFIDARTNQVDLRRFEHGESVPPCKTCVQILPMMLCPGGQEEACQHKD